MSGRVLAVLISGGLTVGLVDVVLAWLRPAHLELGVGPALLLLPAVLVLLGLAGAGAGLALAGVAMVGAPGRFVGRHVGLWVEALALRPRRWIGLGLMGAVTCVVALGWVGADVGRAPRLALVATALLLAALPGAMLSAGEQSRPLSRRSAWAVALLALVALISYGASPDLRLQTWRRTVAASTVLDAWSVISDVDGDGYSGLLFGPDCRPFDPAIHPAAADLPGNGIDEDCAGGDRRPDVNPLAAGVRGGGSLSGRSLILITVAGLPADRTRAGGSDRMVTPGLDLLATRAAVMPRAYAAAPTGPAALYGLMTGRRPSRAVFEPAWLGPDDHIVTLAGDDNRRLPDLPVADTAPTLAELLRTAGYQTVAVTCCAWQRLGGGLMRGFDVIDDLAFQTRNRGGRWSRRRRPGAPSGAPGDPSKRQTTPALGPPARPHAALLVSRGDPLFRRLSR